MRPIVHATNCPCDELSMRRIVRATNCPCDELSATNCLRRIVRATNCPVTSKNSFRRLLSKLNRGAQIFQGMKKTEIKNIRILSSYFYFRKTSRITSPRPKG